MFGLLGILCTNAGTTSNQEINIQNMNVELVAQMFNNYRSNVLFHLEGKNVSNCWVSIIEFFCLQPRTASRTHHRLELDCNNRYKIMTYSENQ